MIAAIRIVILWAWPIAPQGSTSRQRKRPERSWEALLRSECLQWKHTQARATATSVSTLAWRRGSLRGLSEAERPNIEVCYNVEGIWIRRDQPAGMQLTSELKSWNTPTGGR